MSALQQLLSLHGVEVYLTLIFICLHTAIIVVMPQEFVARIQDRNTTFVFLFLPAIIYLLIFLSCLTNYNTTIDSTTSDIIGCLLFVMVIITSFLLTPMCLGIALRSIKRHWLFAFFLVLNTAIAVFNIALFVMIITDD